MTDETQDPAAPPSGGAAAKRKKDAGPDPSEAAAEAAPDEKPASPNLAELERFRARLTAKYHGRRR